ncbi:protein draper-like isoform X1 [Crassostrea angulata]|uniref:protein draper-like isoform X1 n=1 Tax=Magallana angulata TaxID=2784310 RepID=UPI0022B19846|nr:protein draper-like isoform X1 [Crassostrea angulata]
MCIFTVNIALNKPAYMQYQYMPGDKIYDASNAVDGRKSELRLSGGQCASSDPQKQTATWWVNLTSIQSIHHITIFYMTGNGIWGTFYTPSFLGFSVYVSNTTDKSNGVLCFKDTNFTTSTIPAVFTTKCTVHGQFVIYYNERLRGVSYPEVYSKDAEADLCEVEVYGCPITGYYGSNCSVSCPDVNCRYCHIETGTCQGCKPGYQGQRCESACQHGFFGQDCTETCNDRCQGCNNINGLCESGCLPGWIGNKCRKACDKGFYGHGCKETCGHCRDVQECSHINGTCITGCYAGYHEELCKTICPNGYFGQDCTERCKDTCTGCNHVNGLCDSGCQPGWTGHNCTRTCVTGSYGVNCSETCGHCRDVNQCLHSNGFCLNGCKEGYTGSMCKIQCITGSYGVDCNETCGQCRDVNQCLYSNGLCLDGCKADYTGSLCKILLANATSSQSLQQNLINGESVATAVILLVAIVVLILYKRSRSKKLEIRHIQENVADQSNHESKYCVLHLFPWNDAILHIFFLILMNL